MCTDVPSNEVRTALWFLKGLFPVEKFDCRLPPIILKHQLYAIVSDRTLADKQLVSK
jgi:serine/threonine-protein kinase 19